MRKIWTIAILTVLLLSGRVFSGDAVKPDTAPGWLSSAPKVETMTDTQVKQRVTADRIVMAERIRKFHLKTIGWTEKDGKYYDNQGVCLGTSIDTELNQRMNREFKEEQNRKQREGYWHNGKWFPNK